MRKGWSDMLTNAPVSAILPAVDIARARKFYEDKLGFKAYSRGI